MQPDPFEIRTTYNFNSFFVFYSSLKNKQRRCRRKTFKVGFIISWQLWLLFWGFYACPRTFDSSSGINFRLFCRPVLNKTENPSSP
jgi:hypothetical protein